MDLDEKRVIQLKKCFLASKLKMDTKDVNSMEEYDLISADTAVKLRVKFSL